MDSTVRSSDKQQSQQVPPSVYRPLRAEEGGLHGGLALLGGWLTWHTGDQQHITAFSAQIGVDGPVQAE